MKVFPAINCPDFASVRAQVERAAGFALWVHIDVTDGKFTSHRTWDNVDEFGSLRKEFSDLKFELHLMVQDPEIQADRWLRAGADRIIVHLEAMTDSVYILEKCKKYGGEAILAIRPDTEAERLLAHKDDFRCFQVLAVAPGLSGQKFEEACLQKIRFLKMHMPEAMIEVDGGVNAETAPRIKEAGADMAVAASFIFDSGDPEAAYRALNNIA